MDAALLDHLGLDVSNPETQTALRDAGDFADFIDSFVSLRRKLRLSQSDVAVRAGCSQSAVSDFERIGGNPTISTVQRFARALGARLPLNLTADSEVTWKATSQSLPKPYWSPQPATTAQGVTGPASFSFAA